MSFDVPFERNGKSGTNYCRPCCFYLSPYFKGWTLFSRTSGTTTTWWLTASTTLVSSLDSTWQPGGRHYQKPFQEPSVQVWNPLNQIPRVTKVKIGFGVDLEEWYDAHRGLSHLLKEHSNHRTIILTISTTASNPSIPSFLILYLLNESTRRITLRITPLESMISQITKTRLQRISL